MPVGAGRRGTVLEGRAPSTCDDWRRETPADGCGGRGISRLDGARDAAGAEVVRERRLRLPAPLVPAERAADDGLGHRLLVDDVLRRRDASSELFEIHGSNALHDWPPASPLGLGLVPLHDSYRV